MRKVAQWRPNWHYISMAKSDWELLRSEGIYHRSAEFCIHEPSNSYLLGCKLKRDAIELAIWAGPWLTAYKNNVPVTRVCFVG